MSTLNENRLKRPIVKPSRYQTTSSDEAPRRKKTGKTGGQEKDIDATMEEDIRELGGILQENSSLINNNNNNIQNTSETHFNSYTYTAQAQTSTQAHQVDNQYPSVQISPNTESYAILPYSVTPYTQLRSTALASSTFIPPNEHNVLNQYNKFQVPYSNAGESSQITERYRAQQEQIEDETESRKTQERLDRIETELRKLNNTVERILKCVQIKENRRRPLQKPACIPISTEMEMQTFETVNEDIYDQVVEYLEYVGGFTIKEAINLSFKEVIKDSLTVAYTWFGSKQGPRPLYRTRIIMAVYEAVCNSRHFNKPTRAEFQAYAREALRSAKQRHRMATQQVRQNREQGRTARDYWNDCNENENEDHSDVESNMGSNVEEEN
ncbi:uncharacterized protein LOC118646285 [Monomorium pharaonis]|uniref:uncharacterized protein LOC118646285 n=1 Tax=Monomorium pharaonis TaxID=307658 RepID=UPI00174798B1|nr:uncharacterized protein LOC118646285 [Monomorium pharaonis]XP_036144766.1 uncharacterized protein LOC118646285 [Monomorium pharaonis]